MPDATSHNDVIILGGGLAGLSAAHVLARAGRRVRVLEAGAAAGGLARTIVHGEFRFDLGGHRFLTPDRRIEDFVRGLLGDELLTVRRASRIFLRRHHFDYPLQPLNALFGVGIAASFAILLNYAKARAMMRLRRTPPLSLEDWVVAHFGRSLYEICFRDYSEKVWGVPCQRIASEWIAQRIQGLSLGTAIRQAFSRARNASPPTLTDEFLYPRLGIGRIAEKLQEGLGQDNAVLTNARVTAIRHRERRVASVRVRQGDRVHEFHGGEFVSTIPLPQLAQLLQPSAPREVREAAARLRYRDLVIVAVMLNRARATDLTWIYFPEKSVPFGRVHEPTNWSPHMAPPGKTLLIAEHFCCRGDDIWGARDEELTATTAAHLERLGLMRRNELLESRVLRIPAAYPLFEIGYRGHCETVLSHLDAFPNLHVAGRGGMFRYYNMDRAIESGIAAAESILRREPRQRSAERPAKVRRRA